MELTLFDEFTKLLASVVPRKVLLISAFLLII